MMPEKEIKSMFENVAKLYDFFNDLFSFMLVRLWRRSVTKHLLKQSRYILDLGIGTGYLSNNISQDVGVFPVGLDLTKSMVLKNIKKLQRFSDPVIGTATNMPFRDCAFDTIVSSFTLRSFKKVGIDKVLDECARVLKEKGNLVMLDTAKPTNRLALAFFYVYFKIINFIGGLYNNQAYHWLTNSIMDLDPEFVKKKMSEKFNNVQVYKLTGEIAYIWHSRTRKL
jgi:ubiquinone/menaquinone biosynthesis methyltransferase